jgi:hypothetical protein
LRQRLLPRSLHKQARRCLQMDTEHEQWGAQDCTCLTMLALSAKERLNRLQHVWLS